MLTIPNLLTLLRLFMVPFFLAASLQRMYTVAFVLFVTAAATDILDGRPDQQSLGGIDMAVRRNAFGRQVDSFEAPVEIDGIAGPPFHAVFIRAPWVESVGAEVEVLGRVAAGPAAGRIVAVRQGNLLATAFHPELTGDLRVHRFFVEMARAVDTTEG